MDPAPAAYKVVDRSILLPSYKRFFLDPLLPLIPARLHPNWISLAGHLACLAALLLLSPQSPQGWRFVAAALLLQVYVFCDNADGGHARRTGQTSARGELLDHGLDLLSTSYIAVIAAISLHSGHTLTFAFALLLPSAAALTCWEQTQTGIFQMGRLNQIESVLVLSVAMAVDAWVDTDVWRRLQVGQVSAYLSIHLFALALIAAAEARRVWRVRREGAGVASGAVYLLLQASIAAVFFSRTLSVWLAAVLSMSVAIYFGLHCLLLRLRRERVRVDPFLLFGAITMLGAMAASFSQTSRPAASWMASACAAAFALGAMNAARNAWAMAELGAQSQTSASADAST